MIGLMGFDLIRPRARSLLFNILRSKGLRVAPNVKSSVVFGNVRLTNQFWSLRSEFHFLYNNLAEDTPISIFWGQGHIISYNSTYSQQIFNLHTSIDSQLNNLSIHTTYYNTLYMIDILKYQKSCYKSRKTNLFFHFSRILSHCLSISTLNAFYSLNVYVRNTVYIQVPRGKQIVVIVGL